MNNNDIPHGTRSGYYYHKCRCLECKAANAKTMREWRQRNSLDPENKNIPHGTPSGYTNYMCRCDLCLKARRDYLTLWRAANPNKAMDYHRSRMKIINKIKLEAGCIECGFNEHPAALDFDHVRGEKLFCINERATTSMEKLLAEIEKCEVVCANHHRIRTANRQNTASLEEVVRDSETIRRLLRGETPPET